jgi:hypothetical protein
MTPNDWIVLSTVVTAIATAVLAATAYISIRAQRRSERLRTDLDLLSP